MNALKYYGIAVAGLILWTVAGFVHEGQLISACERGQAHDLKHPSYSLKGCKLVRK